MHLIKNVLRAVEVAKAGEGSIAGVAHLVGSLVIRPPHALALEAFNEVLHTNFQVPFSLFQLRVSQC